MSGRKPGVDEFVPVEQRSVRGAILQFNLLVEIIEVPE